MILPKIDSAAIGNVVAGILAVLNESGYQLLLADTQNNLKKELEAADGGLTAEEDERTSA